MILLLGTPELAPAQLMRVGGDDGPGAELFTRLGGAAMDRHGRLIVLDQGESRIVVFAPNGRRTQYLGRRGGGPGEFQEARAMTITATDALLIVDPAGSRLTRYDLSRPDSVRYGGTWPIAVRGTAICASGERVFLLGDGGQEMVHEYRLTPSGPELVRSFGEPQSKRPGMAESPLRLPMAMGSLACSPNSGLVAFGSTSLGEVRVFGPGGGEVGFHVLTPFQPIGFRSEGRGVRFEWPPSGEIQQVDGLGIDESGTLTVTVATLNQATRDKRFETWVVGGTGSVASRTSASGRLLSASPTRVVCERDGDLGPEVMVYARAAALAPCRWGGR
jgi:hypothetical protein